MIPVVGKHYKMKFRNTDHWFKCIITKNDSYRIYIDIYSFRNVPWTSSEYKLLSDIERGAIIFEEITKLSKAME